MEASDGRTEPVAPWAAEQPPVDAPAPVPEDDSGGDVFADRPEVFVGAAFASGLGVALVLRWLGQPMSAPPETDRSLGEIVSDASEKASLLVREEIELAKAEVTAKVKTLGKGAAVGTAAGVFLVFALVMFLHALAWFFNDVFNVSTALWLGFLIVFLILVVFAVIAGLLAKKWLSSGPPTPDMAIEEAKVTRDELEQVAYDTPKLPEEAS